MTTATQPYNAPVKVRPLGVTILAILSALGGIMAILGGMAIMGVSALASEIGALGAAIGGITLIMGLIQLVIAWGLWTGKGWAWLLGLIFGVLGILMALASMVGGNFSSLVSLAINAIIVYYLYTPPVKAFFGR
jgi:hypothetical protein